MITFKAHGYKSYIAASYVKFVEMAGARAVPVLLDQSDEYYMRVFQGTNGMLVPGGGADVHNSSQFIFKLIVPLFCQRCSIIFLHPFLKETCNHLTQCQRCIFL